MNEQLLYNVLLYLLFILIVSVPLFLYYIRNEEKKTSSTKFCSNSDVYIKKSRKGGKFGRGVFANKNFKKGDIIEVAPILTGDRSEMFCGLYENYIWQNVDDKWVLLLGYASICNHDDDNNSDVNFYDDYYDLYAKKDIQKEEEITLTYCNNKTKEECSRWFTERKLTKL